MMLVDVETLNFELWYDARYGYGFVRRKADGAETPLITGSEMVDLRRQFNRARTNGTSKRIAYRPFEEIADVILGEYASIMEETVS